MIKVEDIADPDSLRTWLEETGQPRGACVWLAHRIAMRELPKYWWWVTSERPWEIRDFTIFDVIPSLLRSGLPAKQFSTAKIGSTAAQHAANETAAIEASFIAAIDDGSVGTPPGIEGLTSAMAAFSAARAALGHNPIEEVVNASMRAGSAVDVNLTWEAIRQDCKSVEQSEFDHSTPLWRDDHEAADTWELLWHRLETSGDFSFLITWYQHALAGTETRWDLLERIALLGLPIDDSAHTQEGYDAFWKAPDREVDARLNAIWEDWKTNQQTIDPANDEDILDQLEARTYNAEIIIFNEETGRWRVEPVTDLDSIYMQEAVEEIEELVSRLTNQSGQLRNPLPLEVELSILNRSRRHIDAPRRLYRDCQTVLRRVQAKIKNGDCPVPEKDADIADLCGTLSDIRFTLINRDPEVKKAVQLSENAPDIAPDSAEAKLLAQVTQDLEPHSEGVLAEDFREMSQAIVSQEIGSEERKVMTYILSGRILRLFRVLRDAASATNDALKPFADLSKTAVVLAGATSPWWASSFWQFILRYFG